MREVMEIWTSSFTRKPCQITALKAWKTCARAAMVCTRLVASNTITLIITPTVTTHPRRAPRREMDASMRMPIHRGHHHRPGLSVLAQAARHPMTAVFSPANFASAPGALPRLPMPLRQWKYTVSLNHNHNLPDLSSYSPFLLSVFTLCLQFHDTDYTLLYNRIWCLCMNLPVLSHVFWFVPMQKTRQHIRSFDTSESI